MIHYADEVWVQFLINLSRYIDSKVSYSGRHSAQVAHWARATARKIGLSEGEIRELYQASLFHDIGKICIPNAILQKEGPLTEDEWQLIYLHPTIGANIVSALKALTQTAPIIRSHQEHFDGGGYPCGLAGDDIPISARILSIVDAYEAMTTDRVYRKAFTRHEAMNEIEKMGGSQFDPGIVPFFFQVVETPATVY